MNILITNDDGLSSSYTRKLANLLSKENNVLVVVPAKNLSGASHSLTFYRSFRVKEIKFEDKIKTFSVNGTPSDCVKLVHHAMFDFKIDLVISGVNNDLNVGHDVYYSGTVGACFQGLLLGYNSIAISVENNYQFFDKLLPIIKETIDEILQNNIISGWNINIPNIDPNKILGKKITCVGENRYRDFYIINKNQYFLSGDILKNQDKCENSDVNAIDNGYISITPLTLNRTDFDIINRLKNE